jgi:TrmH family RNA methyltransferase
MISASQQKHITSLHVKKYRQKYRNFLVEGEKMVSELIQQQRIVVNAVFGTERWANANASLLNGFYDKFNTVTETELKKISTLVTPNQVLAIAEMPPEQPGFTPGQHDFTLFLDGIQDPGNMGTILRIADWFGIQYVCCGPGSVDIFSPKVVQSSMGAVFRLAVAEDVLLEDLLKKCPGYPVCGAVMDGESIFSSHLPSSGILVIGNEGKGIQAGNEQFLNYRVTIPRNGNSGAESLNAGVAAGIIVAEMIRRRG